MSTENEDGSRAAAPGRDGRTPQAGQEPGVPGADRTAPLPAVPPPPPQSPPPVPPAAHAAHAAAGPAPGSDPYGPQSQPSPSAPSAPPAWGTPQGHPAGPHPGAGAQPPYGPPPHAPGGDGSGGSGKPGKRRGGLVAAVLAAALVAGGIGGAIGFVAAERSGDNGSTTVSASTGGEAASRAPGSVAAVAAEALRSVVTIEASGGQESGTGTGFVYDKQGHIVTNNHVVAPAADGGELSVTFSDGRQYRAEIVGRAQGYDVAVIKLRGIGNDELKPLPLGNSDKAAVGDATIAIGAPFGLSSTVTTGIVSAKNRPVAAGGDGDSQASYMSAIQTDASINPGNSGGPLLDAKGNVIGINSAIQSTGGSDPYGGSSGGSIGLGFAIPINQADRVAQDLIKTGKPVYAVMGVLRNDSFNGKGAQISPQPVQGVDPVTPGGPADKAGLKPGDVITKLDDTVIDSGPTLVSQIWTYKPGDKVKVTYERSGRTATTTLTLGERVGDN
ncbi:S1C family serine protease [Streptomyces sp. HB2AG]|uniref:S1C family serine protease n=1 Tax=Streptomyces sp. HB2AG TaxID=2983400 RepID=UPI0022AACA73|nr:trypsin-like peptidase domain-containing protein [Streptomyces sp. HB2AG]MCZ2525079.1 trypsin-like peptidase domain-containing protein [Streptomyces sp. HB2AG]